MPKLFSQSLDGAKCVLYGLGCTNTGVMRYLAKHGARLLVCDKRMSEKEIQNKISSEKIENVRIFRYGETPDCDFAFRTVGMRADSEELSGFTAKGIRITDETRLFLENTKARVIGITGSDGKTTTSNITSEILKNAFDGTSRRVFLGGNIGVSLSDFLDEATEKDIVVAELSSFQLMYSELSPAISAITNISENHLDWHNDMSEYLGAKFRIFEGVGAEKTVFDDESAKKFAFSLRRLPANVFYTGKNCGKNSVFCKNGLIFKGESFIADRAEIRLKGEHNLKNYMTAIALTDGIAKPGDIRKAARSFNGVAHRMSLVAAFKNVDFYDSSIDSTPSRAISTLKCFKAPLTVIVGGYDKNLDYSEFVHFLSYNASNVVITGATSEKILSEIFKLGNFGANIFSEANFDKAVEIAIKLGVSDGDKNAHSTVILSPACASFDQFENYQSRGKRFSEIVLKYIDNNCQ